VLTELEERLSASAAATEQGAILQELASWFEEALREAAPSDALLRAARMLASDERWDPGTGERLHYWSEAANICAATGRPDGAAYMQLQGARLLLGERRVEDACALVAATLDRFPDAEQQRPSLLLALAEWRRVLGEPNRALKRLDEFDRAARGRAGVSGALLQRAPLVRAQLYIDLGTPDLALRHVREGLERARERRGASDASPRELLLANRIAVHLDQATDDHAGAIARVDACLADADLYADAPRDRSELLCLAGWSHLALEVVEPERPPRGAELLRECLEAELSTPLAIVARLGLAEDGLASGELEAAQQELDRARALLATWNADGAFAPPLEEEAELAALDVRLALARGDDRDRLRALVPAVERGLEALLARWDAAPRLEAGVGFLLYGSRRGLAGERVRLRLALEGERGVELALADLMRLQERGGIAQREKLAVPSVDELR